MKPKFKQAIKHYDLVMKAASNTRLATARADKLFGYMAKNFSVPDFKKKEIRRMGLVILQSSKDKALRNVAAGEVPESLWPLAVAKVLLNQCPLEPGKMKNFSLFHKTYGKFVNQWYNRMLKR